MQRTLVCKDGAGRITRIHSRRIASMADPHLCAVKFDITPINYSDTIRIRSAIDGTIINDNVPRYRQLNSKHLAPVSEGKTQKRHLFARSNPPIQIPNCNERQNHNICRQDKSIRPAKTDYRKKGYIAEIITLDARGEHNLFARKTCQYVSHHLDKGVARSSSKPAPGHWQASNPSKMSWAKCSRLEQSLEKSRHSNRW